MSDKKSIKDKIIMYGILTLALLAISFVVGSIAHIGLSTINIGFSLL